MLEETHYYPFGLTIAGISSKALKPNYAENKYRYNGKELQNKEFSDGSGLEEYNYGARMYDPQIERWAVIYQLSQDIPNIAPYVYGSNNPINRFDPDGQKDRPFNAKTDRPISFQPRTATPIYIYNSNGQPIALAPGYQNAYNCRSYAWENSQGDPTDPANKDLVSMGISRWDNNPANNIKEQGAQQLSPDEANQVGDRGIYYVDANENGQYDDGEAVAHSAIVYSVDKEGNTTTVSGKLGQKGISINHPDAPAYYHVDEDGDPLKRAYFRLPDKNKKKTSSNQSSKDNNTANNEEGESNSNNGRSAEIFSIINSWLTQNPNIVVTVL